MQLFMFNVILLVCTFVKQKKKVRVESRLFNLQHSGYFRVSTSFSSLSSFITASGFFAHAYGLLESLLLIKPD